MWWELGLERIAAGPASRFTRLISLTTMSVASSQEMGS